MNNFRVSNIADALFTKVQQRVLGILYGLPDQTFYQNEIIRHADMGKGVVVRELEKLRAAGLVLKSQRGNQIHFQANPQSIVFDDLNRIISRTIRSESLIKAAIVKISGFLYQAFIYGAFAEGSEKPGEDINVLLVSDRLTPGGAESAFATVEAALGRKINLTILSRKEYAERITRKRSFISQVMEQPKLWLMDNRL